MLRIRRLDAPKATIVGEYTRVARNFLPNRAPTGSLSCLESSNCSRVDSAVVVNLGKQKRLPNLAVEVRIPMRPLFSTTAVITESATHSTSHLYPRLKDGITRPQSGPCMLSCHLGIGLTETTSAANLSDLYDTSSDGIASSHVGINVSMEAQIWQLSSSLPVLAYFKISCLTLLGKPCIQTDIQVLRITADLVKS